MELMKTDKIKETIWTTCCNCVKIIICRFLRADGVRKHLNMVHEYVEKLAFLPKMWYNKMKYRLHFASLDTRGPPDVRNREERVEKYGIG